MYFDLHCHPSFRPFLTHPNPGKKDNCWDIFGRIRGRIFPILAYQSSLGQLQKGKVNVAVGCVYVMEKAHYTSVLVRHICPVFSRLDSEMLNTIPTYQSSMWVLDEVQFLLNSNSLGPKPFNIISHFSDINFKEFNLILAIEGSYGLVQTNTSLLGNLIKLKKFEHRFLYITLVHATQFDELCTHAFSMKMVKSNPEYKPNGNGGKGFTQTGFDVIDCAYDESLGHRILIDVKHLSLISRRQFYKHREDNGYQKIPILATHMGLAGISWKSSSIVKYIREHEIISDNTFVEVFYDKPAGIGSGKNQTFFNPWSMNLYDEEIIIIVQSDGLIGLNMDQRILGAAEMKAEYFDLNEFYEITDNKISFPITPTAEFRDTSSEQKLFSTPKFGKLIRFNRVKHLRHLCNQILHIVQTAGDEGWKHICIGSDFDGLINSINGCMDSTEFNLLENDLVDMLPKMIVEAKLKYGILNFTEDNIPLKVRGIMYDNAIAFLKEYFK